MNNYHIDYIFYSKYVMVNYIFDFLDINVFDNFNKFFSSYR